MPKLSKGGFYAVQRGRVVGVFHTWAECEAQVKGFAGAKFQKFADAASAEAFAAGVAVVPPTSSAEGGSTTKTSTSKVPSDDIADESGWDVVYSDGACKGNGQAESVAGVGVWWGPGDPRNIAERCPGDQTNNRAELIAIVRILETAPHTKRPLLIKTDSQYSMKCIRDWFPKWRLNGFLASTGAPVKNAPIIRYLDALLDERAREGQKVHLQYVRGHVGIEGNEGADALANRGALLPEVEEREWKELEQEVRAGRVARGEDETGGGRSGEAKSQATEPSRENESSMTKAVQKAPPESLTASVDPLHEDCVKQAPVMSVNVEDIDFSLYEDCALSPEELAELDFLVSEMERDLRSAQVFGIPATRRKED